MSLTWIVLFIEILVVALLKSYIRDFEVLAIYVIGINMFFFTLGITKYKKGLRGLFFSAYFVRLITMIWDVYARNIYILPHSGGDTEGFLYSAGLISNNMTLLQGYIYGNLYTKCLGVIFYITGYERLFAQYINVLLGVSIIIVVYKILVLLEINSKTMKVALVLVSFFPNAIIFSGILLRENVVTFFSVVSFYFFINWYKFGTIWNIIKSIFFLSIASSFHSGIFGIIVGYVFMYMFFNRKTKKLTFSRNTIIIFFSFIIVCFLVFIRFKGVLLPNFSRINEPNDLYRAFNYRNGESAYLVGLNINSLKDLIIFAPIRMLYFLFSPLPMDWRGINDMIAFAIDGFIFIVLFNYLIFNVRKKVRKNPIFIGSIIMLFTVVFIFGVGIANAGTAMRHRSKIFPIIITTYAIVSDSRKTNNMIIKNSIKEK